MTEVIVRGTGLFHSYNMLLNLERAVLVNDHQFYNSMFPAFFEQMSPEEREKLDQAFKNKTVKITKGEGDGDAIVTY